MQFEYTPGVISCVAGAAELRRGTLHLSSRMANALATTAQMRQHHFSYPQINPNGILSAADFTLDNPDKLIAEVNYLLTGYGLPPVVIDDSVTGDNVGWMPPG